MTPSPALAPGIPELGLLERAVAYAGVALTAVPSASPGSQTSCAAWNLTELLVHMHDSLGALEQAGRSGQVDLTVPTRRPYPVHPLPDLVQALKDRACGLLGAWTAANGDRLVSIAGSPLQAGVLAAAGALEVAVHGWDVAQACRLDHPVPQALAEDLLAYLPLLVQPADRPDRFGPALPAPADIASDVRLLAAVGRRVPRDLPKNAASGPAN